MMRLELIGNLGADAEIKDFNGRKFVSFRVAHTEKWVNGQTQQVNEQTTWVSCAMNGDGGKLLPYLKKGIKVFVRGSVSFGTYSSPKTHQMECSVNMSVWEVELCSSSKDTTQVESTQNVVENKQPNKKSTKK